MGISGLTNRSRIQACATFPLQYPSTQRQNSTRLHAANYDAEEKLLAFICRNKIETLDIAGALASKESIIYNLVKRTLRKLFSQAQTRERRSAAKARDD